MCNIVYEWPLWGGSGAAGCNSCVVVLLLATSGAKVGHGVLELGGGKGEFGGARWRLNTCHLDINKLWGTQTFFSKFLLNVYVIERILKYTLLRKFIIL